MGDQAYLTIQEVARRFGVNATTVYKLAQKGGLPGFKIGGQWRFSLQMLESWAAEKRQIPLGVAVESSREKFMRGLLEDVQESKERVEAQRKELEERNKQLQKLSALKDEFVATVSHELRTPMTAIKEGINLVLDGILGPISIQQRDFLVTVDENVDRLSELINHMLDFSKIEAGRMRLFRTKVALPRLVESLLDTYRPLAGPRTLKVELEPVPEVFADQNRLFQIAGNLLSNAIKFTGDNGTIVVKLATRGDFVAVAVQDDGMGIAGSDLHKLFQKFSQLEEGKGRPRGTGLGLAISKELVQMHKGTIDVSSTRGTGSTFTFTVPVYTPQRALSEHMEEMINFAKQSHRETVGIVVLDSEPLHGSLPEALSDDPTQQLERMTELISKLVHSDDQVFLIEPRWIVALSITDALGVQAISERIQTVLRERAATFQGNGTGEIPIHVGTAVYPTDGTDVQTLFAQVTRRLASQGVLP